jgi:hypothetical protein
VGGFIAPAACDIGLGRPRCRPTFQRTGSAREAAMTWDQVVTWFILPAIVAVVLGGGGAASRSSAESRQDFRRLQPISRESVGAALFLRSARAISAPMRRGGHGSDHGTGPPAAGRAEGRRGTVSRPAVPITSTTDHQCPSPTWKLLYVTAGYATWQLRRTDVPPVHLIPAGWAAQSSGFWPSLYTSPLVPAAPWKCPHRSPEKLCACSALPVLAVLVRP